MSNITAKKDKQRKVCAVNRHFTGLSKEKMYIIYNTQQLNKSTLPFRKPVWQSGTVAPVKYAEFGMRFSYSGFIFAGLVIRDSQYFQVPVLEDFQDI